MEFAWTIQQENPQNHRTQDYTDETVGIGHSAARRLLAVSGRKCFKSH